MAEGAVFAHLLAIKGFKTIRVGVTCICVQNLVDHFSILVDKGYWRNSALHALLWELLCTLSIILQNSAYRGFNWLLSPFSNPWYIRGPKSLLPHIAIGSMSDWNILSLTITTHCTNHTDFSFK